VVTTGTGDWLVMVCRLVDWLVYRDGGVVLWYNTTVGIPDGLPASVLLLWSTDKLVRMATAHAEHGYACVLYNQTKPNSHMYKY